MKIDQFPDDIRPYILPEPAGCLQYQCLGCGEVFGIEELLYTCPSCRQVLLIVDSEFDRLKLTSGAQWRKIFDYRKMSTEPAIKGIYRYHEFLGSVLPLASIVYLGEGHTPVVEANADMKEAAGVRFFFKNDGQNPSASFKDRGMASALSYINYLVGSGKLAEVLAVCASTGDTSAAAALYAAYLPSNIKSAVLLPRGKVTPQQLAQPLGSGATVFEIPGVFDDCMKVVEALADNYPVALLNSKNAWRILGQESYSYETAQAFEYVMDDKVVVVPIGNAGNITAVLSGFLKFFDVGIIEDLPKIIGVQSAHANPVCLYYAEPDAGRRQFRPVTVKSSVAQAAMIGNPVSMPRVIHLVDAYNRAAGRQRVFFEEVTEQQIMDWHLLANRNGHISCTHGGESLAGLVAARKRGVVEEGETAIVDSTAHALKFQGFQTMYFENTFPAEFSVSPDEHLVNAPRFVCPENLTAIPAPGKPIFGDDFQRFVDGVSGEIASILRLDGKKRE